MKTSKLYLAAALISLGAKLDLVDRTNPRRMEFVLSFSAPFVDEQKWLNSTVESWDKRELSVNAQDYVDAIQKLKVEVHQ